MSVNKTRSGPAKKMGAPTRFKKEYIEQARKLCAMGHTDIEIADVFGVSVRTLYRWKGVHADFCHALKVGKDVADDRVERSLYAKANGFEHDEVDIRVVAGKVVQTPIRKFYPPDTVACIFWLKNRRRDEWRDKVDHEHGGPDGGPIAMTNIDASKLSDAALKELLSARRSGADAG